MIPKLIADIQAADIEQLVVEATREGRSLEFKRELPGGKESDRKEFLADVSSFANAAGGDLIYGVGEMNGVASEAIGLAVSNIDAEVLRLDQMIRSGVSPRLAGTQIHIVHGLQNGPAVVIRISRSWQGPHAVSYQQDFRFYSRSTNGKFRMDSSDVRDSVFGTANVEERIRLFRIDRVARIAAGETPVLLDGKKLIAIHVLPLEGFANYQGKNIQLLRDKPGLLEPLYHHGYSNVQFNVDGVYVSASGLKESSGGYVQCFRNGALEAVDAWMIPSQVAEFPDSIHSVEFSHRLFALVERTVRTFGLLQLSGPVGVFVSVLGSKGAVLWIDGMTGFRSPARPLDRDVLLLPDVVINDTTGFDAKKPLRPLLDTLWQAFGIPRCSHYNEQGEWIGVQRH